MTTPTDADRERARAVHARIYNLGVRFNSYEKDDPIVIEQIALALSDAEVRERVRMLEVLMSEAGNITTAVYSRLVGAIRTQEEPHD